MTSSPTPSTSELDLALEHYAKALEVIEKAGPNANKQQIVGVLTARDAVDAALPKDNQASEQTLVKLIDLDTRLKQQAKAITTDNKLAECCQSLKPPKSSWWWFLTPPPPEPKKSAPYNWVWHGLTMICIACSSSLIFNTSQVFFKKGFDFKQILDTITQTTGVALVAGGSLTTQGRKTVSNVLSSLKIPHHFYPEATFGASLALLLVTFSINRSLPSLSDRYYQQGEQAYKDKKLATAQQNYEEALTFNPNEVKIKVGLGKVHRVVGELDQAKSYYQQGIRDGDSDSLNGMGAVVLAQGNDPQSALQAETYFRLALDNKDLTPSLQADIHTNLGHALYNRSQQQGLPQVQAVDLVNKAEKEWQEAIKLTPSVPQDLPGRGMASCYLALSLEQKGNRSGAQEQWNLCDEANPETFKHYQIQKLHSR